MKKQKKHIEKLLAEIKAFCSGCPKWSGTDCTQKISEDCLKQPKER